MVEYKNTNLLRSLITKEKTFASLEGELDSELIKSYLDYCDDLKDIPREYITEEIIDHYTLRYVMTFDFLFKIPEYVLDSSYRGKVIDSFIEMHSNDKNWICYIPQKYITEDIIIRYINAFKNVDFLTEELITSKIAYLILKNDLIGTLPQTAKSIVRKKGKEYQKYQYVIESNNFDLVKEELILSIDSEINIEKISSKHKVSKNFIFDVLSLIEIENTELALQIKVSLEKNNELYLLSIYDDLIKLKQIIKSFGRISGQVGLTKEQKIQFSILFSNANIKNSITEIYLVLKANKKIDDENFSDVFRFLSNYLGYNFYRISNDFVIPDDELCLADYNTDWILEFDKEKYFKMKDGNSTITYKFINRNNEVDELTPELALEIVEVLKKKEIPTKNCIVKEAFRKYFSDELEEFIENIKTVKRTGKSLILRRN